MRRLLYVPSVSQFSVADNEGYQEFFALTETLKAAGEKVFWYVVMPSWVTDGVRGHDRMQYIYMESTRDPVANDVIGFPAFELAKNFARRGGMYIIDAAITNCARFGAYLGHLLSDAESKVRVPVFLRERDTMSDPVVQDTVDEWLMLAASYVHSHTVVCSEAERRMLSMFVGRHANPSVGRVFLNRSVTWTMGYDINRFDRIAEEVQETGDRPILFCGGSFFSDHKREEMRIARDLFALGAVDVTLTSPSPRYRIEWALPKQDRSFISKFNSGVRHDAYLKEVARSHLFVSTAGPFDMSDGEEEISRLLLEQVGIFPHVPWARESLGEEYPFYYNLDKNDEAVAMAEWVAKNYEDASLRIAPIVGRLRREHDQVPCAKEFWKEVVPIIDENYTVSELKQTDHGKRAPLFAVIYKVAKGLGDEFPLSVFLDVLEEHVTWLKPFGRKGTLKEIGMSRQLPTLYDIRQMLDNLGWIDTCETSDVVLRRERDPLDGVFNE